jgi:hypothetical protein
MNGQEDRPVRVCRWAGNVGPVRLLRLRERGDVGAIPATRVSRQGSSRLTHPAAARPANTLHGFAQFPHPHVSHPGVQRVGRPGINDVTGEVGDSGDCGRFRKTAEDDACRRKPLESRGTRETPELRKLRQRPGVPPSSAPAPEAASPSDELCAIPAIESAASAPITFRQVGHAGGADPAHADSGNGVPPHLSARARRRLRRREKLAQSRNAVASASHATAA